MRPRHDGYIAFQGKASALLRQAFEDGAPADGVLEACRPSMQAIAKRWRKVGK